MLLHLNILFFLFAKALGTFLFYSDTQNKQITPKIVLCTYLFTNLSSPCLCLVQLVVFLLSYKLMCCQQGICRLPHAGETMQYQS